MIDRAASGVRVALFAMAVGFAADHEAPSLAAIRKHALEDLSNLPNYVCVDSIDRAVRVPSEREFRLIDRVRLELAHIEDADRFSWIGSSAFLAKTDAAVNYGLSL